MIVGVASGLPVETVRPWAASARKVWDGPISVLTDTPQVYLPLETAYDVELVPAKLREVGHGVCDIARTRWKALGDSLSPTNPAPVVVTDTRDVVFQSNPLTGVGEKLLLGSEGKTHAENPWTAHWLKALAPDAGLEQADVLNAGVLGGPEYLVRVFALTLYHRLVPFPCQCTSGAQHMTDQTLVNVLARNGFASDVEIREDWVFHVRSMDHQRIPAIWQETRQQLLREDGAPFPIVHQYDLAPAQLSHFAEIA